MKQLLSMIPALFALACSAGEDMPEMYETEPQIGKLEQPLFVPDTYGVLKGAQTRCPASSWGSGTCLMPDRRNWNFRYPASSGVGKRFCDRAEVRGSIETAVREVSFVLNSLGWSTQVVLDNGTSPSPQDVVISCDNNTSGTNTVFGYTIVPQTCIETNTDCHSSARGQILQYGFASITMFPERVYNNDTISAFAPHPNGFQAKPEWQRRNFLANITMHELFHVAGLGHAPWAQPPAGSAIMGFQTSPNSGVNAALNALIAPEQYEKNMLDCYKETSGTTPNC